MYCLVGLGNPGAQYVFTRHNVGFILVDYIQNECRCSPWEGERLYIYSKCTDFILIKPTTYMNLSGEAFPYFMRKFNLKIEDMIVAYDDIWLPLGKIRIRKKGSDGGHNGIKSIIDVLETENCKRIRIGIGPKPAGMRLAEFVLGEFSDEELSKLYKVITAAKEAFEVIINDGIDKAMSMYNSKEVE
ncbi:MAG: aminoacyl-tRNA hydrolase [Thermotogaceae bacterium]|nr:aminoacyl-tRNA hydrolase [Thermotogaceae bacterium]